MKKKIFLGILFLVGILLLSNNFYSENKIITEKKAVKEDIIYDSEEYYEIYNGLYVTKVDENEEPQDGVTMKLFTGNEDFTYTLRKTNENGWGRGVLDYDYYGNYATSGNYETLTQEDAYSFLSNEQLAAVNSVHTMNDIYTVFGENNTYCMKSWRTSTSSNGTTSYHYPPYCGVTLPTVFTLEETRVPAGYSKKKVYVPAFIWVNYSFENVEYNQSASGDSTAYVSGIYITPANNGYYMEYGEVEESTLKGIDAHSTVRIWKNKGEESEMCSNISIPNSVEPLPDQFGELVTQIRASNESNSVINFYDGNYCPIYLQNIPGEVILEITSSVNNKESITTNINQVLEYKVSVKNVGTLDAIDNTVKSKLPEGFVYVEGSATAGGTYSDGVVTWQVDRINKGSNVDLTYQAYAPRGVNAYQNYIGEASVENDSIEGHKVEANKTYVKLSLNNPSTYAPIGVVIFVILLVGGVLGIVLRKQQKQN